MICPPPQKKFAALKKLRNRDYEILALLLHETHDKQPIIFVLKLEKRKSRTGRTQPHIRNLSLAQNKSCLYTVLGLQFRCEDKTLGRRVVFINRLLIISVAPVD